MVRKGYTPEQIINMMWSQHLHLLCHIDWLAIPVKINQASIFQRVII